MNRSEDAGTTWGFPGFPNGKSVASGVTVQPQPKFGTVNALLGGIDHAAVDPTTGNVFVAYGASNGSGGNAVFIKEIKFDNANPSNPILGAGHQVSLPGAQAALPSVAVAPDGTVGVLYTSFDGFSVDGFPIFSGHFAFSTDAGATFTDNTLLTFLSPAKDNGNSGQRVLGDYQQLKTDASQSGAVFNGVFTGNGAALGDASANNNAIFFQVVLGPLLKINTTNNFGTLCPGQTPTEQLELFNAGSSDLIVSGINRVAGSPNFTLSGPSFPVTISPNAHVDFTVSYNPLLVNEGVTQTGTFQINSNDVVNQKQQVIYSATVGQPTGSTTIADNGNYGNVCVGSFADLNLTVANSGTCDLLINNITSSNANFLKPGTIAYPVAVHKGTSLAAPVRFQPITTGLKNGIITVVSPNNPNGNMAVNVNGNAPPGKIVVSGSGAFGNVCSGNPQQVITVGNVGPCNLHVTSVTLDNGSGGFCPDFKIVNNPFPNTLSPDSSLPVTIAFTPTSAGPKSCRLIIQSDDLGNPTVIIPLTATTGTGSIDVPSPENFPPTVIQSLGACASKVPFPVSNNGACPLQINSVVILNNANGADFSLEGLPSLAAPLQPGHTLGDGNLDSVFNPTLLQRAEKGTIRVNYETDPVTHATATVDSAMCGEGVLRGARVLVEAGGVPLSTVKNIVLFHLLNNGQSAVLDRAKNVSLQTVNPPTSCTTIQFHREWGAVSNPLKRLLTTTGQYEIVVRAKVNGKTKTKTVKFAIDNTCTFNPNIIVNF